MTVIVSCSAIYNYTVYYWTLCSKAQLASVTFLPLILASRHGRRGSQSMAHSRSTTGGSGGGVHDQVISSVVMVGVQLNAVTFDGGSRRPFRKIVHYIIYKHGVYYTCKIKEYIECETQVEILDSYCACHCFMPTLCAEGNHLALDICCPHRNQFHQTITKLTIVVHNPYHCFIWNELNEVTDCSSLYFKPLRFFFLIIILCHNREAMSRYCVTGYSPCFLCKVYVVTFI